MLIIRVFFLLTYIWFYLFIYFHSHQLTKKLLFLNLFFRVLWFNSVRSSSIFKLRLCMGKLKSLKIYARDEQGNSIT